MKTTLICVALMLVALLSVPTVEAQFVGGRGYGGYYGSYGGFGGYGGLYYPRYYGGYHSYYGGYCTPYYGAYSPYSHGYYRPQTYYYPPTTFYGGTYVQPSYQSLYSPAEVSQRARVTVRVPSPDAEVWFNGQPTRQQGLSRIFESPELTSGSSYSYQIRARWTQDGRVMDQTRDVNIQPGQGVVVDFTQ